MSTVITMTDEQKEDARLHRSWAITLKPGHRVNVKPLFNETERPGNRLTNPVKVVCVRQAQSQTGVMLQVKDCKGLWRWLDAGWFERGATGG